MRLERLQSWMQAAIMGGGPVEGVRQWIKPSRTLGALERLEIYRGMYEIRLVEALRVDYPGLERFLGEETFDELVRMYVRARPSQSYTLNRLGDRLPELVEQVEGLRQPRFVRALAELELAETIAFDGDSKALRLVALTYPAHRYLEAMREGTALPVMRPRRTRLAVYRDGFAVRVLEMKERPFAVLGALVSGVPADVALGNTRENDIYEWFREWSAAGIGGLDDLLRQAAGGGAIG